MFDDQNIDRSDAMGRQFGEIKEQVLPPPALEKAVIEGVPYGKRVRTATHVLRFAKAVAAYVVGVALFLGALFLLPRLWEEKTPVGSDPVNGTTTKDEWKDCLLPDVPILNMIPYDYESVGSPDPGMMSAEVEAEIKQAYAALNDRIIPEDVTVHFIANLDGKYAVTVDIAGSMHLSVLMRESVCGLCFLSSPATAIRIYDGKQLYSVSDAYEQGVLSARRVQELYVISQYFNISPVIRAQCAKRYGGTTDDYFVRFMKSGSRDGGKTVWYIVYLYGQSIPVTNVPTSDIVGGYQICYPDSRKMEVYYEGEFYTMTQAMEQGIVSESSIRWLYEEYLESDS